MFVLGRRLDSPTPRGTKVRSGYGSALKGLSFCGRIVFWNIKILTDFFVLSAFFYPLTHRQTFAQASLSSGTYECRENAGTWASGGRPHSEWKLQSQCQWNTNRNTIPASDDGIKDQKPILTTQNLDVTSEEIRKTPKWTGIPFLLCQ